jgi:hypothetical protein
MNPFSFHLVGGIRFWYETFLTETFWAEYISITIGVCGVNGGLVKPAAKIVGSAFKGSAKLMSQRTFAPTTYIRPPPSGPEHFTNTVTGAKVALVCTVTRRQYGRALSIDVHGSVVEVTVGTAGGAGCCGCSVADGVGRGGGVPMGVGTGIVLRDGPGTGVALTVGLGVGNKTTDGPGDGLIDTDGLGDGPGGFGGGRVLFCAANNQAAKGTKKIRKSDRVKPYQRFLNRA